MSNPLLVEGFVQPRKLFIVVYVQYNDNLTLFQ